VAAHTCCAGHTGKATRWSCTGRTAWQLFRVVERDTLIYIRQKRRILADNAGGDTPNPTMDEMHWALYLHTDIQDLRQDN
jgi:hypothetical protein